MTINEELTRILDFCKPLGEEHISHIAKDGKLIDKHSGCSIYLFNGRYLGVDQECGKVVEMEHVIKMRPVKYWRKVKELRTVV